MTEVRAASALRRSARHEQPAIDELALEAARWADLVLAAVVERGSTRWISYFEPIPDRLRDDEPAALRATAIRCRAAYGVKDSVRDVAPWGVTEPFLDAIDRLLREINRSRG
jgi:hypothetical protein